MGAIIEINHYRLNKWSVMADRRPTRTAFGDISNIIGRGMLVDIVNVQFLKFFSETNNCDTHYTSHQQRQHLQMMKRQIRGKRGIENNVNIAHGKGPRKPTNKERSGIESNVNTVQGKKHRQY
jgi:ATP:corrinoid adenosyltransferase